MRTSRAKSPRGTRRRRGAACTLAAALLGALAIGPGTAPAATYSNPTAISIPQGGSPSAYPSSIEVEGVPGEVARARVTLHGIQSAARDPDILLVGPGASSMLISDVCTGGGFSTDFSNRTFTLDDDAASSFPALGQPCIGLPDGSFKPTNYDTADVFPSPAPPPPYPLGMANFNGSPLPGSWRLFAVDDVPPEDSVSISGGWSLEVIGSTRCTGREASAYVHFGTAGKDVIVGTSGPDVILGMGGKDKIRGLGGKDRLCGGAGKDKVIGGSGKDICIGGGGNDSGRSCEREKSL